jgi:hypothetical protein
MPTLRQQEKQALMDYKDREYDSDDEVKQQMMTYDDRLTLINQLDHQNYVNQKKPVTTTTSFGNDT